MKEPTGVAVDNDGRIFVADRAMGRVEIFDIWGTWSKSIRLTIYPVGIEIDPDIGTLYVADCKNKIIEVYKVWDSFKECFESFLLETRLRI